MRHKLALLASLLAILGSAIASVNVHRAAVQQQVLLDARQAALEARQTAEQQLAAHQTAAQLKTALTSLQRLQAQCQNGLLAYNLLTAAQKEHVVKPDCSL